MDSNSQSRSRKQGTFWSWLQNLRSCRAQPARHGQQLILTLDSAYEYTDADLDHWDAEGPGFTFRKYYPEYYDLALSYGLDPALKPTRLDISETVRCLGYKPSYSLANLLSELAAYGDSGPPQLTPRLKRRMLPGAAIPFRHGAAGSAPAGRRRGRSAAMDPGYEHALDQAMQWWLGHVISIAAAYFSGAIVAAATSFALSYWLLRSPHGRHRDAH
jgi:hypothetical protein